MKTMPVPATFKTEYILSIMLSSSSR